MPNDWQQSPSPASPQSGAASDDLSDRSALRQLVDEYAATVDARDAEGFAALFGKEGVLRVVEAGGSTLPDFTGDGITGALEPLADYEATMHLTANHRVKLANDEATGQTYCLAQHLRKTADGDLENLHMVIRYEDTYARTATGWRFGERICRILWMEVHPAYLDLRSF